MIRTFIFILLVIFSLSAYSQTEKGSQENYCLFGFISDEMEEYDQVISYLNGMGMKIVSSCKEECLIYIQLNKRFKDYAVLFTDIEKNYNGKCYFKSQENKIPLYNKCREQYIKNNINN